jgi:hypothetical protein
LRAALAWLALCAIAGSAHAARIEGQVRHATRGEVQADLRVQLLGFDAKEQSIERVTRTDAQGRFRFDDLPAPGIYLVRPEGTGFVYPGTPVAFRPGEPETAPPLALSVYDASEDGSGLRVAQVQWVVERDAGVYRVSQRARIANSQPHIARVADEQPALLRIGLASGHGPVAGPFDRLPAGVRVADGVAEVRGPVFPGEEGLILQVSYDVPSGDGGALATEITTPDAVDELGLYVQDFGVEIAADGLHPSRVVLEDDVFFQSFIGFDLPARGGVPLRVTPLPPARSSDPWGVMLLAALIAGALVWFVGAPVTRGGRARLAAGPREADPVALALQGALADLEHDFETGKLSVEDRARIERELTAAGAHAATPLAAASPRRCACGHVPLPSDRFCAACGSAL